MPRADAKNIGTRHLLAEVDGFGLVFRSSRCGCNCANLTELRHYTLPPVIRTDSPDPENRASTQPGYAASTLQPHLLSVFCLYYMRKVRLLQAEICTNLQKLFVYFPLFRHVVHDSVAIVRLTRTVLPMLPAWYPPKTETHRSPNIPQCVRRHI